MGNNSDAQAKYLATGNGRAAKKRAQAKYLATDNGRAAAKRAQAKYLATAQTKSKTYTILLHTENDADIIHLIDSQKNKNKFFKKILRSCINGGAD